MDTRAPFHHQQIDRQRNLGQASFRKYSCAQPESLQSFLGVARRPNTYIYKRGFEQKYIGGMKAGIYEVTVRMMRKFPSSIARQSSENMRNKKGWRNIETR